MLKKEEEAYMDKHLELFGKTEVEMLHKKKFMKTISKKKSEAHADYLIDLINNPRVRRHIPLSSFNILNKAESMASVNYKEQMWTNEGYGSNIIFI